MVNSYIPDTFTKVQYIKFDQVVEMCVHLGPSCYIGKTDIKSAFHLVALHPMEFHLLGMENMGKIYVDKCLPFGMALSCQIFEKVSTAVEYIVTKELPPTTEIRHYLDDLLAGAKCQTNCNQAVKKITMVCQDLGIPILEEKTVGNPAHTFLGSGFGHYTSAHFDTRAQSPNLGTENQTRIELQECESKNTPEFVRIAQFLLLGETGRQGLSEADLQYPGFTPTAPSCQCWC